MVCWFRCGTWFFRNLVRVGEMSADVVEQTAAAADSCVVQAVFAFAEALPRRAHAYQVIAQIKAALEFGRFQHDPIGVLEYIEGLLVFWRSLDE